MKKTMTVLTSTFLALLVSEILLRAFGLEPWSYASVDSREPTMHEPDPVLGWRSNKGAYLVPPYHPSGQAIHMTFEEDGKRRTGGKSGASDGEIIVVGGSVSQGWAINDWETYAWKLQERYPSFEVINYGTGGYGGYQSLLVLEQQLPEISNPRFVLYGFIQHHERRNVAPASWLRTLSLYSKRGHVETPFATLHDTNGLIRHPPEGYSSFPLRESLATVKLLEHGYMNLRTMGRLGQRRVVTEQVLLQMNELSGQFGAILIVVILNADKETKRHYLRFLDRNGIDSIDCVYPITPDTRVAGEGHPNGKMHAIWAQRISRVLDEHRGRMSGSAELTPLEAHGSRPGIGRAQRNAIGPS